MHQQENTDVLDVVFQIVRLTCQELRASLVAFGVRLRKFQVDNKGGIPDAIEKHAQKDLLKKMLTPSAIMRMTRTRPEYIMQQLLKVLGSRTEFQKIDLKSLINSHQAAFYEIDSVCGLAEPETLASVYGAAMTSLLKNKSFRIDDVTDSVNESKKADQSAKATAAAEASAVHVGPNAIGNSVTSQAALSQFGIRLDYANPDDVSSLLKKAESLFVLRSFMSAQITAECRSNAQKGFVVTTV